MTDVHAALGRAVESFVRRAGDNPRAVDLASLLQMGGLLQSVPGPWSKPLYACLEGSRMIVQPHQVAHVMLGLVLKGRGVTDSLDEIGRLLVGPRAEGMLCAGLVGPVVEQDHELAPDLWISPAAAFPDFGRPPWTSMDEVMNPVSCCVRVAEHIAPVFSSTCEIGGPDGNDMAASHQVLFELETVLVLLTHPTAVTSAGTCFTFDDPTLNALSDATRVRTTRHQDLRRVLVSTSRIDVADVKEVWSKWRGLTEGDRGKLLIACDRINRSLLQVRPVDKCIEACIALEVLFGGEPSDSVTHKIATRAARYLESGVDACADLSKFVKSMYAARSKGVHAGQLKTGIAPADQVRLTDIAVRAAKRMILAGGVPAERVLDFG